MHDAGSGAANRARWDEAAPLHAASEFYDLDGMRAGRHDVRPFEVAELGSVAELDLIHLQCHLGTDTLSWARRGARVVGLDFSAKAVEIATRLANECRLDAEFVCADVYDARHAMGDRVLDVVYTGIGALNWLADLHAWAGVVADLLRPRGVLYLAEIHPIVIGVVNDGRTITHDILDAPYLRWEEKGGTYAVADATMRNTVTYERPPSVAEVISAVLDAGLVLELFHEHSYTNGPRPWMVRGTDGYYRLPAGWPKYPLMYSLLARKPG